MFSPASLLVAQLADEARAVHEQQATDDRKRYVSECEAVGIDPGRAAMLARGPPPPLSAVGFFRARCEGVCPAAFETPPSSAKPHYMIAFHRRAATNSEALRRWASESQLPLAVSALKSICARL